MNSSTARRMTPVHVVGIAATPFAPEQDGMLDELVFDVVHAALAQAGLRKQDAGISVSASMDVLDARSISSGLYTAAAGGYLNDSYRIEGDSGLAIAAAAQAVAAGDVEVAIAVGVHNPETRSGDEDNRRSFTEQISNLAFDPHFGRPVGLSAETVYGLHASYAVESGETDVASMAALAAREITRGSDRERSVRREARSAEDVAASRPLAHPLSELMMPAHSTGAVALVLASPARAGRCTGRSARITGLGHASGRYLWDAQWLADAAAPTRRATALALASAGADPASWAPDFVEVSAASPALHHPYLTALGVADRLSPDRVNVSGGLRSNYPGLANGALRLLEAIEHLEGSSNATTAMCHSVDTVTGTVSEDVTVMLVEAV